MALESAVRAAGSALFVPSAPAGMVDSDPPKSPQQEFADKVAARPKKGTWTCPAPRCGRPISANKPFCKEHADQVRLRMRAEMSGLVIP